MQHYKYYFLVFESYEIQILCLFLCSLPIYIIGKIYSQSWIDPLRISLFFVVFANAVPTFLYYIGEIKSYLFYSFLCSEFSFWIGFVLLASRRIKLSTQTIVDNLSLNRAIFHTFFYIYIVITIITYSKFGLPIFNDSRIATYHDSGGFGIFARISPFISNYVLMYSYYLLDKSSNSDCNNNKTIPFIVFATFAVTSILSGSKSAFLPFVFSYFGYYLFYKEKVFNFKKNIKYVPIILSGAGIVLWLTGGEDKNILTTTNNFFLRLISTGDCYYMSYPNEIINDLNVGNSELFLFSNVLAPLRLVDPAIIPKPLGVQMTWLLYPNLEGIFIGPNSRPAVIGYVLYGSLGGMVFSFIVGLITSFLMFRFPSFLPKSFLSSTIITYVYISSVIFITDVTAGMGIIFDIILNLFFLLILLFVIISIKRYVTLVRS